MSENIEKLIKKNKGILRQLTALNNEVKGLKGRIRLLEKSDGCHWTKEEIENFKLGGTDPD